MRNARLPALAIAAVICLAAGAAGAETLYKLIDKNGKVTYAGEPPKDFDGKVIPLNIDTSANTANGRKPSADVPRNEDVIRGKPAPATAAASGEAQVKAAREKVEAARKAYAHALEHPGENDVQRLGTKSGFTRPVYSEEYQRKLDKLDADVKQAEQELARLEQAR